MTQFKPEVAVFLLPLCWVVELIELYLFMPVTLTYFSGVVNQLKRKFAFVEKLLSAQVHTLYFPVLNEIRLSSFVFVVLASSLTSASTALTSGFTGLSWTLVCDVKLRIYIHVSLV